MKTYNKLEKYKEFENKIKQKFQLLESLNKLHNIIMNIYSSADHTAEFLKLVLKIISLDNYTQ